VSLSLEIWCQGYSEPNAGSDLASLQTHAVERDGFFIMNGSKIWTSMAHRAQWIFVLARTDQEATKHHGISYLLCPMDAPGITISPLIQMTGARHFNQVFFDDVRVPVENIVGAKNEGWKVLARLARRIVHNGRNAWDDASVRQKIAQFAAEASALRYTSFRQLTRQLKGLPPGPEASLIKIGSSELGLRMAAFAMELLGPFATLEPGDPLAYEHGQWAHRMLEARGPMIYSGTNEIQRNILGERILGLPR
jgi:alkylation response protein AidB-like acyl-CoA dehydrogenase